MVLFPGGLADADRSVRVAALQRFQFYQESLHVVPKDGGEDPYSHIYGNMGTE
jgi:hypothetical protein